MAKNLGNTATRQKKEKKTKKDLAREINMSSLNSREEYRYIRQKRQQGPHGVNRVLELPKTYKETYAYAKRHECRYADARV